ncbi:MAG: hypothetical protein JJ892_03390 [Balneola sp.]|nr:hypothetical protein [Balneola sp.]MBO6650701.1 hypothetical protein [Balneola sp.]MBO6710613.1 hypothetical protein [Balneola sp.]MBO6799299.1 hypothetical protein [Balneola sp.]MBO6869572.1 hypothetical protein [Balneola sp.]
MYKVLLLIHFIILFCSTHIQSQSFLKPQESYTNKYVNSLYAELGGAGVYLSINYDLTINETSVIRLGASPSILRDPNPRNSTQRYKNDNFPIVGIISYSRLFGGGSNKIETGTGIVFGDKLSNSNKPGPPAVFFNLGYRFFSKKDKGIVLKASFTPFIKQQEIIPWAGISFGYSFFNQE